MAELPSVAGLWIGGPLTWLEQLCLKSFVDMGHPTALYTYENVPNVPEGVEIRDGHTIMADPNMYTHERSGSVALFSDAFRFQLMVKAPGTIWIDTDVYCVRPLDLGQPHVFGYETEDGKMNGAILALPTDSDALGLLLDLTSDPYKMPEFYKTTRAYRNTYLPRAEAGDPVHVGEMPWGVWGPHAITWAMNETGEVKYAQNRDVLYPVHFTERDAVFRRPMLVSRMITEDTRTVHIWGRIKRRSGKKYGGSVPDFCWLYGLLDKHGIDPNAALVKSHGKFEFEDPAEPAQGSA